MLWTFSALSSVVGLQFRGVVGLPFRGVVGLLCVKRCCCGITEC